MRPNHHRVGCFVVNESNNVVSGALSSGAMRSHFECKFLAIAFPITFWQHAHLFPLRLNVM